MAYPLYLLHNAVLRFYWAARHGLEAEFWFPDALGYPVPVEWYELFIVIALTTALGWILEKTIAQVLMPYTVSGAMAIATFLARCPGFWCCGFWCGRQDPNDDDYDEEDGSSTTYKQIANLVAGLTGGMVSREMKLTELGLDSLGASAILSTLRASVSSAKNLTMQQLSNFETIGDLVDFLEETKK